MGAIRNHIRKEQTTLEFNRLRSEVEVWNKKRAAEDTLNQYKTQLAALENLLDVAAVILKEQLYLIDPNLAAGDFYEQCRLFDLRVLWLRKVWNFYREKFDQRDDPFLRPTLKAADEVVWSCFNQVFVSNPNKRPTAPLPFIESSYSPQSFPSELVPYNLKPGETGILQDLMNRLPIPLVSLPQSCVNSPWWLVYVRHEIGHQIQHSLLDNKKLVALFQNRVKSTVEETTKDEAYAEKWGFWGQEIFADVYSVLMMGEWALWTMVEFELQNRNSMLRRRPQYPSPIVRLTLLNAIASELALDGHAALRGIDLTQIGSGNAEVEYDLQQIPAIVKASLTTLPELSESLETLADFRRAEFQTGGYVSHWAQILPNKNAVGDVSGNLRSPRLAVCAALASWAEMTDKEETERAALRQILADNTIELVVKSREESSREAETETAPSETGRELSELLLRADKNVLEF